MDGIIVTPARVSCPSRRDLDLDAMGNQHSAPPKVQMSDILAVDVPSLVYKDQLHGTGRFLKSIVCRVDDARGDARAAPRERDDGIALVKVYVKRPGAFPDLRAHERAVHEIREALTTPEPEYPHCWPFTRALETENAVYLMRQFCHMSLHDRLSARPFLSDIERAWFAYQLLHAARDSHARGVEHGDIKCENVLVTSWGWCFLCDYASYKPAEIPADNPAAFTYFFDSDGRRRCCLAPERFSNEKTALTDNMLEESPTKLHPSADIFALGCTLAELYMDGKSLFDLSDALSYRRGEHDPAETLKSRVKNEQARAMISSMVAIDPSQRRSAHEYLVEYEDSSLFPSYFTLLHAFSVKFLNLEANGRLAAVESELDGMLAAILRSESGLSASAPNASDEGIVGLALSSGTHKCPGVSLVAAHVCSAMRGATNASARVLALKLLQKIATLATDHCTLQLILPYCASMLQDQAASVRAAALRTMANILENVEELPKSDFGLFPEYIWPMLSNAAGDTESLVRVTLMRFLANFARLSLVFLQYAVANSGQGGDPISFDEELVSTRDAVQNILFNILHEKVSEAEDAVWEELSANSADLARFFGRDSTNDFLMPLMITCLNVQSPQRRCSFFKHVSSVGRFIGQASCERVLVPCIDRCLIDSHDSVIAQALRCMSELATTPSESARGVVSTIGKRSILMMAKSAGPLLCHPSPSVRNSAQEYFATAAQTLGPVDALALLVPIVQPFLDASDQQGVKLLSLTADFLTESCVLATCLYPPPSRAAFENAVSLATGMRTAAVYAAVRAPLDRPVDAELAQTEDEKAIAAYNAEMEFPSIKAMSSYIKLLAHARQMRMGVQNSSMDKPSYSSNELPSIIEGEESDRLVNVNDAWTTVFGARRPLIAPQDAQAVTLRDGVEEDALLVDAAESSMVDTLSAAVRRFELGAGRFKTNGPPDMDANASTSDASDSWAPRGVLVAHLLEHRGTVTSIAVDKDEVFFATGSEDGSCKIWDSRRIEKDVSFQSRLTYASQGGKITSIASTSDSHIVSGSDNGTVHAWRVEYTTKEAGKTPGEKTVPDRYTGAAEIRHVNKSEGAVNAVTSLSEHMACYITQGGAVYGWDYRSPRDAFRMLLNPKLGVASSLALDTSGSASWLVIGTASGSINLLDMRFQTCVQEWNHPSRGAGIEAMAISPMSPQQSSAGAVSRPLVWCSAGHDEVALWDIADGGCRRILRVLRGQDAALDAAARAPPCAMEANGRLRIVPRSQSAHVHSSTLVNTAYGNFSEDLRADELMSTPSRPSGVRALLALPDGGIVSGSTDACIRVWYPGDATKSRVVSGKISGPRPKFAEQSVSGVVIQQEYPVRAPANARQRSAQNASHERHDCHRDAVVALAAVSGTSGKMLISASRDMSVKVWK
jgi:phosphoinositide-3-kinase regulatory subunit 4